MADVKSAEPIDDLPALIVRLYEVVDALQERFPGRKFTPDGHLVGSLGEVLAAHHYDLELLPASYETHDARAPDGRLVQIKATQVKGVGLRSAPEHLLVLKLERDGASREVFNGPGDIAWNAAGRMQKNGQRAISITRLRTLMEQVSSDLRLPGAQRGA